MFEFGDGLAIKLLRPGLSEDSLRSEAEKAKAVILAGAPAPSVQGLERIDGRLGIVFERANGAMMVDLIIDAPGKAMHWGSRLGTVHVAMLSLSTDRLADVKDRLRAKIAQALPLSRGQRRKARDALDALPTGSAVLHGDFHPLNVFLAGSRATVIDWADASRGPAAADIARTLWLISPHSIPPEAPDRDRVVQIVDDIREAYLAEIFALTDVDPDQVDEWALPVLAGRLSEGIEHERVALLARIGQLITRLGRAGMTGAAPY